MSDEIVYVLDVDIAEDDPLPMGVVMLGDSLLTSEFGETAHQAMLEAIKNAITAFGVPDVVAMDNSPAAAPSAEHCRRLGIRLRQVNEDHARHLAENIEQIERLRSPIEVRKVADHKGSDHYTIIAGGHRFRAVQLLGWPEVPAFVFEMTDQEARIWEIDENIRRHELNPLDRAVFLAERQRLYLELHPETTAGVAGGKARRGSANEMISFASDAAKKCGLTPRTIQLAVSIANGLPTELRQQLAGTALARKQSELLALIKLEPDERRDVLDLLLAVPEPAARNVAEAVKIVRDVPEVERSETEAAFQKLLKVWGRAKIPARRQFLKHLMEAGDMGALLGATATDAKEAAA